MEKIPPVYKIEHTAARRHSLGNILVYLLLTIWALVVLFPFTDASYLL